MLPETRNQLQKNTGADGGPMVTEIVYRWANQLPEGKDTALSHDDDGPYLLPNK